MARSAGTWRQTRKGKGDGFDLVVDNRKARHDFFIEDTLEAGIALTGTEVKSLRAHKANLRDSYARIKTARCFWTGVHIGAYAPAGQFSHKETRPRKLLMHRREIDRLWGRVRERGYSIVPLKIYFKDGRAKVEFALAKGKHASRQARGDRAQDVGSGNPTGTEEPKPLTESTRESAKVGGEVRKPSTLARQLGWSVADVAKNLRGGVVKCGGLIGNPRDSAKLAFLVEEKFPIQRVQNQGHETRGAEQASRDVHHVAAAGRLRGNRSLEFRVDQMFPYDCTPKLLGILRDHRLESARSLRTDRTAGGIREPRRRKSAREIRADGRADRCCAGARRCIRRSPRAPRRLRGRGNRRDDRESVATRRRSRPGPIRRTRSPTPLRGDRQAPAQLLPEPASRTDVPRRSRFRDRCRSDRRRCRAREIRRARSRRCRRASKRSRQPG